MTAPRAGHSLLAAARGRSANRNEIRVFHREIPPYFLERSAARHLSLGEDRRGVSGEFDDEPAINETVASNTGQDIPIVRALKATNNRASNGRTPNYSSMPARKLFFITVKSSESWPFDARLPGL